MSSAQRLAVHVTPRWLLRIVLVGATLALSSPTQLAVAADSTHVSAGGAANGLDPTGLDPTGLDPTGLDPTGLDPTGLDPTGLDPTGLDPTRRT